MTTTTSKPVRRDDYSQELWAVENAFHRMASTNDRHSKLLWALRLTRAKKALRAARADSQPKEFP